MNTKILPILVSFLLIPGLAVAQQGTIAGTVIDAETGESLPGATVQIPSLDAGTAADANGEFSLRVAEGEYQLQASFVGYQEMTRTVSITAGSTTRIRIRLQVAEAELDEVVVTASQRERQARSLGYNVSEVSGQDLEETQETNLVQSLSGKVSGVEITSQSGNVGAGSSIIIRGISSLTGDNQPLFVIDGQPVSNANIALGDSRDAPQVSTGNAAGQFNANNIESISVLRSGAAAALYGSRARNGVILIETKDGSGEGAGASFSSSVNVSTPSVLPNFQNEFGPGDEGKYDIQDLDGWGPRMEGQEVEIFTGETIPMEARNPVEDFWDNGIQTRQNVSFQNAGEFGNYRLGFSRNNTNGIVPESNLERYNVNLNAGTTTLDDNLDANVSTTYIKETTEGRARAGGNNPNILVPLVNGMPRHLGNDIVENNFQEGETTQIGLTETTNNPYWIVNKNQVTTDTERFYGSLSLSYEVFDWLTLQEQLGTDIRSEQRRSPTSAGTFGSPNGEFFDEQIRDREIDHDFTIRTDNEFGDFTLQTVLGNNINQRTFELIENQASNLTIPAVFSFPNARTNSPDNFFQQQRIVSAYGSASFGFRNYAFLEVTGRNDWSSTLPEDNNSYFYPSVSLSLVVSDLLEEEYDLQIPGVSYAKLRGNFAQVGSDTDPYQTEFLYGAVSDVFTQFVSNFTFPFRGVPAFAKPGTIPPTDLKPQQQKSWEFGAELGFFDGRVNLDLTYYQQDTEDQILDLPIPQTTGFANRTTNAGTLESEGIEATLDLALVTSELFRWDLSADYGRNRVTVGSLPGGLERVTLPAGGFNDISFRVRPGERPILFGPGLERTENGELIINPSTGLPEEGDTRTLGNLYPDFSLGVENTFGVGNFSFSFLVDWQNGGKIFSSTVQDLRASGLAEETVEGRRGSFVPDGVIVTSRDDEGNILETRPNDVPVPSMEEWWGAYTGTVGPNVFDATYVKLREVAISYSLPESLTRQLPIEGGSVQLQGRNFLLYSEIPHIDPEVNLFGAGATVTRGYEFASVPQTSSYGATLNLRF